MRRRRQSEIWQIVKTAEGKEPEDNGVGQEEGGSVGDNYKKEAIYQKLLCKP